ncbi:alpha/beta hydrolase [Streptomyces sp. NPDC054838]
MWANEPCSAWPARAAAPYTGPWNRATGHPALVLNTVYDPSTPYRAGQAMAAELAGARLLTLDGYGHTALDNPSACVQRHVVRYVLTGALPPVGARCAQDTPPFGAAPARPSGAAPIRPAEPVTLRQQRPVRLLPTHPGWAGAFGTGWAAGQGLLTGEYGYSQPLRRKAR